MNDFNELVVLIEVKKIGDFIFFRFSFYSYYYIVVGKKKKGVFF